MGLYDMIECDYPLPGNPECDNNWQTKSLRNLLDYYKIGKDGSLYVDPIANDSWQVLKDFRGEIVFHNADANDKWWEYSALFDNGKLLSIKCVSE